MSLEIEPMLALSTAHLTEEVCNGYLPGYLGPAWQKSEYGWFVYVVEDTDGLPPCLKACLELAREHRCFWVMFDCDGPTVEGLPVYDWQAAL